MALQAYLQHTLYTFKNYIMQSVKLEKQTASSTWTDGNVSMLMSE
jgi:hypothetical protein